MKLDKILEIIAESLLRNRYVHQLRTDGHSILAMVSREADDAVSSILDMVKREAPHISYFINPSETSVGILFCNIDAFDTIIALQWLPINLNT